MGSLAFAVSPPIVQDRLVPCVPLPLSRGRSSNSSEHADAKRLRVPFKPRSFRSTVSIDYLQCSSNTRSNRLVTRAKASNRSEPGSSAADLAALEEGEPWLGAVVYRRSAARQEFVFVSSLERLALPHLSSAASRAQAAETLMAEIPQDERTGADGEGEAEGTAVVVRMRSSKVGRDIRLDGTAQTVFAMQCHRCLCPVTEPIYSEFSLLLSASPLHEPTKRSLGVILDAPSSSFNSLPADYDDGDEGDMLDLDLDDKLYFPPDQRIIDVSKYVRDTVHLEIPLKVRCSPGCRGMCLGCGANLNVKACSCGEEEGIGGSGSKGQAVMGGQGQGLGEFGLGRGKGKGKGKGSLKEQLEQLYRREDDGGAGAGGDDRQQGH